MTRVFRISTEIVLHDGGDTPEALSDGQVEDLLEARFTALQESLTGYFAKRNVGKPAHRLESVVFRETQVGYIRSTAREDEPTKPVPVGKLPCSVCKGAKSFPRFQGGIALTCRVCHGTGLL